MSGDWIGRPEWTGIHAVRQQPEILATLSLHDIGAAVRRMLDAYDYADAECERLRTLLQHVEGARSSGSLHGNREFFAKQWREITFQPEPKP